MTHTFTIPGGGGGPELGENMLHVLIEVMGL